MKKKTISELDKPICPLWLGGHCPYCDYDWVDAGIPYAEAEQANRDCCQNHRHVTQEELNMMYSDKSDTNKNSDGGKDHGGNL